MMINIQWPQFLETFLETKTGKILFRVGIVLVILILILYVAYSVASIKPGFYRRFEKVSLAERKKLNDELVTQVLNAWEQIQKTDKWSLGITDQQLNGWMSVDGSSNMVRVLPKEIKSPRIAIRGDQIEIAAPVTYRSFSATAILSGTIRVPEPGMIAIRFRSARLGVYPFDKEQLVEMAKGSLDNPDWELQQTSEGGDPVLSFRPKITLDNQYSLTVESFQTDDDGQCLIKGSVTKVKKR